MTTKTKEHARCAAKVALGLGGHLAFWWLVAAAATSADGAAYNARHDAYQQELACQYSRHHGGPSC